jgi:hypothetical protein
MQNLKQTLADRGLAGTLLMRENGAQIPLRFEKGQTRKLGKLTLGAAVMDVEFVLEEIPGAPAEQPNLRLTIQTGPPPKVELVDTLAEQTAAVEAAAKKEADLAAETKAKAEAEAVAQVPTNTTTNTSAGDKSTAPTTTTTAATANKPQNNNGAKKGN